MFGYQELFFKELDVIYVIFLLYLVLKRVDFILRHFLEFIRYYQQGV